MRLGRGTGWLARRPGGARRRYSTPMIPGERVADRFVIERKAGTGGTGTVFRAVDTLTGDAVALKVLHEERSQRGARFVAEARVLSELRHPGIVRYVTHGMTRDHDPYLAMEWLEGED